MEILTNIETHKIESDTQAIPADFDYEAAVEELVALGMSRSEALAWIAFERGESEGDVIISDTESPTLDSRFQEVTGVVEPAFSPQKKIKT